jgi:hypothetical protein
MWEKTCTRRKERERPRRIEKARHKSPHHPLPLSLSAFLTRPLLTLLATGGCTVAGKSKTTARTTEEQEIEAFNDIDPNMFFPGSSYSARTTMDVRLESKVIGLNVLRHVWYCDEFWLLV